MSLLRSLPAMDRRKLMLGFCVFAGVAMVTLGVFASNDWLPKTDPMTGKKTGWFGRELPKHATSAWNPFPPPSPTPQLSKEYIYAGSRMLAVEDANAVAAPPADIAVWRPSNGVWYVIGQTGSQAMTVQFGTGTLNDIPLVGDYDGDGKTDLTVWRPDSQSVFWVWPSGSVSYYGMDWGTSTDIPTVGDFDGDGRTDYVVGRPSSGAGTMTWWVLKSSDSSYYSVQWGAYTDVLAPADYDGDGKADLAVYRPGNETFYITNSSDGSVSEIDMNVVGSHIVSSDYDGDGKADPALYVDSTATWYVHQSTTGTTVSTVWGNNGGSGCTGSCSALKPVQNDYDGDGKTDFAVWTPDASASIWTIKRSSNGTTRTEYWGVTTDIPVPAFYRR